MIATPTGGGPGANGPGKQPAGGKWGTITITGLPTGQYTVYTTIVFSDGAGGRQNINSPTSIINVP